jgi:hypothetical protein
MLPRSIATSFIYFLIEIEQYTPLNAIKYNIF